ncbi:MAG TPA: tetratricopeptide repeat protein [Candidatus Nanopelagicales bacterium]|nr:tetratricopeptide repeat protein [Candidatus Nanopelagicales bacterium]
MSQRARRVSPLTAAALLALAPLFVASCGEDPKPPPKVPQQQQQPAWGMNPQAPGMPQWGMTDAPSSARPFEAPPQAGRPAMNPQAAMVYQQGLQAFANGDLNTAKTLFQQATQADPSAHQAFYSLGVVQERLRDAGAGASYRQAFTLVPDYEPAIIGYAMLLAKKEQLGEAERILNEKQGQMPKSAAVAATLAEIKSLQRDTGSAQRIAQEALKLNPDYRPAMVIIARDHYRSRRLDLALYALQAILDGFEPVAENPPRDKDNPEALLLRGLIYREQGQRRDAMDQFRRAVARRPDMVEARVQLATLLLEAGNAEEALPLLEGAVRFDGESLPAHLALGDAYRLLQRYGDAKRELELVEARSPNTAAVHYNLGLLYLFAPSIPGMTPKQQVTEAMAALKRFQELRKKGESDDSDELINRAKLKEGEIAAAAAAAAAPPPPPPPPSAPSAPAAAPDAGAPQGEAPAEGQDQGGGE